MQTGLEDTQESTNKLESVCPESEKDEQREEPGHYEFKLGEIINKKYKVFIFISFFFHSFLFGGKFVIFILILSKYTVLFFVYCLFLYCFVLILKLLYIYFTTIFFLRIKIKIKKIPPNSD